MNIINRIVANRHSDYSEEQISVESRYLIDTMRLAIAQTVVALLIITLLYVGG